MQDVTWSLTKVDKDKHTISVEDRGGEDRSGQSPTLIFMSNGVAPLGLSLRGLKVAADATITLNGEKAKLEELKARMRVSLRLSEEGPTVTHIAAISPDPLSFLYILKEVDAAKSMLTVGVKARQLTLECLTVAADCKITLIEQPRPATAHINQREVKLKELRAGMPVSLELVPDKTGNLVIVGLTAGVIPGP